MVFCFWCFWLVWAFAFVDFACWFLLCVLYNMVVLFGWGAVLYFGFLDTVGVCWVFGDVLADVSLILGLFLWIWYNIFCFLVCLLLFWFWGLWF